MWRQEGLISLGLSPLFFPGKSCPVFSVNNLPYIPPFDGHLPPCRSTVSPRYPALFSHSRESFWEMMDRVPTRWRRTLGLFAFFTFFTPLEGLPSSLVQPGMILYFFSPVGAEPRLVLFSRGRCAAHLNADVFDEPVLSSRCFTLLSKYPQLVQEDPDFPLI